MSEKQANVLVFIMPFYGQDKFICFRLKAMLTFKPNVYINKLSIFIAFFV